MREKQVFSVNKTLFLPQMNSELKEYTFKTDISSIYQMFWITYDILKISPNTDLDFDTKGTTTVMYVANSNLSDSEIQLILMENFIEFEKIS